MIIWAWFDNDLTNFDLIPIYFQVQWCIPAFFFLSPSLINILAYLMKTFLGLLPCGTTALFGSSTMQIALIFRTGSGIWECQCLILYLERTSAAFLGGCRCWLMTVTRFFHVRWSVYLIWWEDPVLDNRHSRYVPYGSSAHCVTQEVDVEIECLLPVHLPLCPTSAITAKNRMRFSKLYISTLNVQNISTTSSFHEVQWWGESR